LVAQRTGAVLRHVGLTPDTQEIDVAQLKAMLGPRTKLVATVHVSNMLGSVLPAQEVVEAAHQVRACRPSLRG
jgi:cysteine desulfurase / selenocysteine lyase